MDPIMPRNTALVHLPDTDPTNHMFRHPVRTTSTTTMEDTRSPEETTTVTTTTTTTTTITVTATATATPTVTTTTPILPKDWKQCRTHCPERQVNYDLL